MQAEKTLPLVQPWLGGFLLISDRLGQTWTGSFYHKRGLQFCEFHVVIHGLALFRVGEFLRRSAGDDSRPGDRFPEDHEAGSSWLLEASRRVSMHRDTS